MNGPLYVRGGELPANPSAQTVSLLFQGDRVERLSPEESEMDRPGAGHVHGCRNHRRGDTTVRSRVRQDLPEALGHDLLLSGLHHVGHHGESLSPERDLDARRALRQSALHLPARNRYTGGIPLDRERGSYVGAATRLDDLRPDCGDRSDRFSDVVEHVLPPLPFRLVVAVQPHLHGRKQAHDLLLADLHGASQRMVRGSMKVRGMKEVLASQHEPGGLGTPQTLASAVRDRIGSVLQVPVRHIRSLGCRIYQRGNTIPMADLRHILQGDLPPIFGIPAEGEHRSPVADSCFELRPGHHLDHLRSHHPHGVVVYVAVTRLDHYLIFHARAVGQSRHFLGIGAGHTRGRNLAQSGCTAIGDQTPFRSGSLCQPGAHMVHQFIHVDVLPGGVGHSLNHFGQR